MSSTHTKACAAGIPVLQGREDVKGAPPSPPGGGQLWGQAGPRLVPSARQAVSRRLFIGAAAALAIPALHAQTQVEDLGADVHLAPWQGLGFDGRPVSVPAVDKPTVVNFWATWCPPCRAEMPLLQQMAEFYGDRLVFQAVDFKERAVTVQLHLRESNWSIPVVLDPMGAGAQAWGVQVFPTTFGFDAHGHPRWRVIGEYDWSSPQAGKLVESLWR